MEGMLAISTADFSLYHDLVRLLRERNEPFLSLPRGEPVPAGVSVLICAPDEEKSTEFSRTVSGSDAAAAVMKAIALRDGEGEATLIIGVDPGMRSGYALTMRGRLLDSGTVEAPESLYPILLSALDALSPQRAVLKVGHGDPMNRDRCVRCLWSLVDEAVVVDETRTSGRNANDHVEAALTIARLDGQPLTAAPDASHSPGHLRDLQRVSRRQSGDITISARLAEDVAHGRMSMDDAIRAQRLRAAAPRPGSSL